MKTASEMKNLTEKCIYEDQNRALMNVLNFIQTAASMGKFSVDTYTLLSSEQVLTLEKNGYTVTSYESNVLTISWK